MALLGDDGRGYELARKLESHGVWRTWLGDSLYPTFIHFLSSPANWDAFMRVDSAAARAKLHIQLRVRALLFDKAYVSLFLRPNPQSSSSSSSSFSSIAVSKLNPNYLQLHGDDIYFTLEEAAQRPDSAVAAANAASSKNKSSFGGGSRFSESEIGSVSQRFNELPETWYAQFFEKYRASKSYRLSFGDQETEKRTPEQMSTYLRVAEKHKRKRVAFKEDQHNVAGNSLLENGSNVLSTSAVENSNALDDEAPFFPETMFTMNCVPDSAVLERRRIQSNQKVEFNGVLDTLPQIVTKSPIMIERLGIRSEYLNVDSIGNQSRGRSGSDTRQKLLGQEQASQLTQKVMARFLHKVGFEGSSEVPLEVLSQLLSCHVCKLGRTLKVLADSYRKQCSAIELVKMFLHTTGYSKKPYILLRLIVYDDLGPVGVTGEHRLAAMLPSNLGVLSELVKDTSRNVVSQTQQQVQAMQMHLQSQQPGLIRPSQLQGPVQQSQQITRQMQLQLMNPQHLAFQQQHQQQQQLQQLHMERMKRRQQAAPRPSMNMAMDKDTALLEVKLENLSDFPMDSNTFATMASRHSQLQQLRQQQQQQQQQHHQQQQLAALTSFHAQTSNQIRPMSSHQIPQIHSPNMGMARAPPVKVEGFQELMGGDATLKHDSEENKLTSPGK